MWLTLGWVVRSCPHCPYEGLKLAADRPCAHLVGRSSLPLRGIETPAAGATRWPCPGSSLPLRGIETAPLTMRSGTGPASSLPLRGIETKPRRARRSSPRACPHCPYEGLKRSKIIAGVLFVFWCPHCPYEGLKLEVFQWRILYSRARDTTSVRCGVPPGSSPDRARDEEARSPGWLMILGCEQKLGEEGQDQER